MEVFEVLNSYHRNNEVLSPKSLRTTELEISANFIFSSGERTFSNSAAKHPPASDSALSWTGVKVLSSVTLLPALPQILTIELSLFCPWHGPGRFSVVHSLAPQLWVSRCLWGLPLPPRLSINKCHDGAYGGRCTSMGWQRARAAPRPRRWETTVSLGYRDWEGAPHLGRRTGDASLSFRGLVPYRSSVPRYTWKTLWLTPMPQAEPLSLQGPQIPSGRAKLEPCLHFSPTNDSQMVTSI